MLSFQARHLGAVTVLVFVELSVRSLHEHSYALRIFDQLCKFTFR